MADLDKIGGLPVSGILIYQGIPFFSRTNKDKNTIFSHQLRQKAYFRYIIDCSKTSVFR